MRGRAGSFCRRSLVPIVRNSNVKAGFSGSLEWSVSVPTSEPDQPAARDDDSALTDRLAARELLPLVYAQLHSAARRLMSDERTNHTLQATALVGEAYARLAKELEGRWAGPREFYLAAAQAMQRILIDHARKRGAAKRGGDWRRAALDVVDLACDDDCGRLVALDEAIVRLEQEDPRAATVVRLRFYAGLDVDTAAEVVGMSRRTALRDWEFARAWLLRELRTEGA